MFISYAIITTDTIQLYLYDMDTRLTDEIRTHLSIGDAGCEDGGNVSVHLLVLSMHNIGCNEWYKLLVSLRFVPLYATATRIPFKIPLL